MSFTLANVISAAGGVRSQLHDENSTTWNDNNELINYYNRAKDDIRKTMPESLIDSDGNYIVDTGDATALGDTSILPDKWMTACIVGICAWAMSGRPEDKKRPTSVEFWARYRQEVPVGR